MYATIALDVNFWQSIIRIDEEICGCVRAAGCPVCQGPLDRSDYERKPRGVSAELLAAFCKRLSLCCRKCRKRTTPPSVRFLGRKVYVGAIVVLATIGALMCGAARQTLERWRTWWTASLPATTFWHAACARLVPALAARQLPGGLLERFEQAGLGEGAEALVATLRFLQPITSRVGEHFDGRRWAGNVAQKMNVDQHRRDLLGADRTPGKMKC